MSQTETLTAPVSRTPANNSLTEETTSSEPINSIPDTWKGSMPLYDYLISLMRQSSTRGNAILSPSSEAEMSSQQSANLASTLGRQVLLHSLPVQLPTQEAWFATPFRPEMAVRLAQAVIATTGKLPILWPQASTDEVGSRVRMPPKSRRRAVMAARYVGKGKPRRFRGSQAEE